MVLFLLLFFMYCCNCHIYNETIAIQCVKLSQYSYCNSSCENCVIDYIVEHDSSKAIQGYDYISNSIFTAFRGSSNIHNWIENIQIYHVSPYSNTSLLVEGGFYKEYSFIKSELFENLQILSNKYNTNDLLITGHSAGASSSTLMAYDIANMYQYNILYFYNFGSPRVGNYLFAYDFNEKIQGFRIVHNNDIVPSVPPSSFDYYHISQGICYDEDNYSYELCYNDNPKIRDLSVSDHLYYLNISMGGSYCGDQNTF